MLIFSGTGQIAKAGVAAAASRQRVDSMLLHEGSLVIVGKMFTREARGTQSAQTEPA